MDMRDLVQASLGEPERKGPKWSFWKCPKHAESRASFGVTEKSAYCFSCQKTWFPVWFLRDVMGWSKEAAMRAVTGERYSYVIRREPTLHFPPLPPSLEWQEKLGQVVEWATRTLMEKKGKPGREELICRGITPEVWQEYKIGWQDERMEFSLSDGREGWVPPGLVIPAYCEGKLWTIKVRTRSQRLRYCQIRHGSPGLPFGIQQLRDKERLAFTEAELCALTIRSLVPGVDVLALRGTNTRIDRWEQCYGGYGWTALCLDGNDAGQTAAAMLLEKYTWWHNRVPPEGLDPGDMAKAGLDVPAFVLGEEGSDE
jgi:hypothetical protein